MEARLESGQLQLIQLIQPIQRDIRLVVLMHHVSGLCGRQVTAAENQSRTRSETIEARQLKLWLVMASGPMDSRSSSGIKWPIQPSYW